MSNIKIRQVLEVKLATILPALATVYENKDFTPVDDVPYQEVVFLFAKPENPTMGDGFYRQRGYMQVTLRYPKGTGALDAGLRGELIKDTFKRGLSLTANGVTVKIDVTPEVGSGSNIEDRYVIIVKVRFYADLTQGV
jgi:hypothetical protein